MDIQHWYAFEVKGWLNVMVVKAFSEEEALEDAASMAAGEDNVIFFRRVTEEEAEEIIQSYG